MRGIAVYLCIVCAILFSAGCGKGGITPDGDVVQIDTKLVPATYTADVVEGSEDGKTWINFTLSGSREVLTLKPENTYTSETLVLSTGLKSDLLNGTWSLSANGGSFTCVRGTFVQTFTIQSLTPTTMVVLFNGGNINTLFKNAVYSYNRITYTRK